MEERIIDLCRAGDQEGFAALFSLYKEPVYRLAYGITGNRAMAEDATQEAFIRAFHAIGKLRFGAPFGPWFYAILVNQARTLVKLSGTSQEGELWTPSTV